MILRQNLFLAALFSAGLSIAAVSPDRVKIDAGEIKGTISGRVVSFKGIPYAAPPVGQNRWRPPQPVTPWSGERAATDYAHDCMQLPFPSDAAPLGTKPNEDCLYLNVWTPVDRTSARLPVMVWIYGGGFVNGGSSPAVYDGSHFAENGVVLVSFNYRVGRFGFFAHPALTKENPSGPLGNYAFMDQIEALRWVQRNASAFGGDPQNVTIFGESAGGMSVLALMTSPLSQGLFSRAIIESGGGRSTLMAMHRLEDAEKIGVAFATQAGIQGDDEATLQALRNLPADKVVNGLNMASMGPQATTYSGPMVDGKVIVEPPDQALAAGRGAKVPVIAGANSLDIGFSNAKTLDEIFGPFGSDRDKAKAAYSGNESTDPKAIGYMVAADRMMLEPARFVVQTMTSRGQPSYEYRFGYVASSMRKEWLGAPHATEIPFVFNTVAARYGKDLTSEDEAMARVANLYWVNFAKSGNPNGSGLPKWRVYDSKQDVILEFTNKGPVAQPDPLKQRLDLTQRVAESAKK